MVTRQIRPGPDLRRATPAFGPTPPYGRRGTLIRLGALVAVLVLALVVRSSGVLQSDEGKDLPAMPGAAKVVPGLVRAGAPSEQDLVLMRDSLSVRTLVAVERARPEEKAVAKALGMRMLELGVPAGAAPTARQVLNVLAVTPPPTAAGPGAPTVFMHDETGVGPVVVTAALIQLARKVPVSTVLASLPPTERAALSPAQDQALQEAAAAVSGGAPNPYSELRTAR